MRIFIIQFLVAILFAGIIPLCEAKDSIITPYVVLSGADTKLLKTDYLKIDTKTEWTKLWLHHTGNLEQTDYDYYYNKAGVPEVDFLNCMVIAIFQAPGYSNAGVRCVAIMEKDNEIIFDYDNKHYQTGETSGPGNAFGFFVVPRSDKKIIIRLNVQTFQLRVNREPPIWKKVAVIEK